MAPVMISWGACRKDFLPAGVAVRVLGRIWVIPRVCISRADYYMVNGFCEAKAGFGMPRTIRFGVWEVGIRLTMA